MSYWKWLGIGAGVAGAYYLLKPKAEASVPPVTVPLDVGVTAADATTVKNALGSIAVNRLIPAKMSVVVNTTTGKIVVSQGGKSILTAINMPVLLDAIKKGQPPLAVFYEPGKFSGGIFTGTAPYIVKADPAGLGCSC